MLRPGVEANRGKLGNGERWGMANRAISCRRGKSYQMFSPWDVNSPYGKSKH